MIKRDQRRRRIRRAAKLRQRFAQASADGRPIAEVARSLGIPIDTAHRLSDNGRA